MAFPSDMPGQKEVDYSSAEANPDALHNDSDAIFEVPVTTVQHHELSGQRRCLNMRK